MNKQTPSVFPGPKPAPVVGNIPDIDTHAPVQSLMALAREYGPIFRMELPGRELIVVSSQELVNELCDERRFDKKVHAALWQVRDFAGDGLFTAETQEPDWGKAHRILMPVFGPAALRNMFPGLLSFALYALLRNPEVMARAREEVEKALGNAMPGFEHIAQFSYRDQVLKEALRLWPTAPAFAVYPYEAETTLGGKYPVRNDQTLFILAPMLHRDPKVWGADAEEFNPDHFAFENAAKLPPNAWKPFGNGQRACIGRPFALQEATLLLAMILQRFDLSLTDPGYQLEIKETLTMKPHGLEIYAKRRANVIVTSSQASVTGGIATAKPDAQSGPKATNGILIQVLFGSNAGSAEAFAQRIATDARAQGYLPTLSTLDSAAGKLPTEGAVVVVTASYEGHAPDNARKFMEWIDALPPESLTGVKYVVFGCGNRDWARTYQAIPKHVDEKLEVGGAKRLMERGEANARGDFFGDFDRWYEGFWTKIGAAFGQEARTTGPMPLFEVEFIPKTRNPTTRQSELEFGMIVENRELANLAMPNARSKHHIEVALPEGMHYRAGDYLAVLPLNPAVNVDRALHRFGLAYDAQVKIHLVSGGQTFFPTDQPVTVGELLASYVELGSPATHKQVELLIVSTPCPPEKQALTALLADDATYEAEILHKRVSVLDLLERTPSCGLTFAAFLQMLAPLKTRQYSISSSPLWSADHCTLTLAVVDAPALSGQGRYYGAASTHLAQARPGTKIPMTVRPSQVAFHPPESLEKPLIMVCAGTGIAPFRGFLQDRAARIAEAAGQPFGPALLFFGCTHPDVDFLYKEELTQWEAEGILRVHPAFSNASTGDVKYVQDRLWQDRAEVVELVKQGATFFVCGDGRRMAPGVYATCVRIYQEATHATQEQAEQWISTMERLHGRYVADVFA